MRTSNHSNGYSSVGSIAWERRHQKAFLPTNVYRCKGQLRFACQQHVVWNSYTRDSFDRNWNDFLTKYGLGGNKWLLGFGLPQRIGSVHSAELYKDRHIWIPVYLEDDSGLPETICETIRQLPSKQRAKREREFDAADFHTVILYATKSAIEAQFQHMYTHEKFREVQAQFRGGILCRHSLSVLSFKRVDNMAPKYILEYWSKNIKRKHTHIKKSQDEPLLEPRSKRLDNLVFWSHNICKFASEFEELTEILHRAFDKVMAEMQEYQERSKGKSSLSHEEATLSDVNDLQSPPCVKTRGGLKNRLGSNLERKISNATKKKKKTAPSKLNLLDGRSNIQSSYNLYNALDMNYPRHDYTCFNFY
ncbi:hypothetical protein Ahy_A10g048723 [Arachis hypogaea]|uniref:Protein FAR1-RELATED SEQUENCE n=1 Tax=Arachis hypogaea TaxID=3818 RepID=A0A445B5Q3_ARAHY|nr:hypothetical protein Ahy_A10g048723 [Arachis hypogaea]